MHKNKRGTFYTIHEIRAKSFELTRDFSVVPCLLSLLLFFLCTWLLLVCLDFVALSEESDSEPLSDDKSESPSVLLRLSAEEPDELDPSSWQSSASAFEGGAVSLSFACFGSWNNKRSWVLCLTSPKNELPFKKNTNCFRLCSISRWTFLVYVIHSIFFIIRWARKIVWTIRRKQWYFVSIQFHAI